jgi:flagellar assembly factor FliW
MTAQVQAASLPQFHDTPLLAVRDVSLRMNTSHLGEIGWKAADELYFPAGLPGFEQARRMVPVEIPSQRPLIYLQSADYGGVCFVALPVLTVDSQFQLQLSDDDQAALGLEGETAMLGADVMCLALLIPSGPTVRTNLHAPIVINLHNGRGVQAVASPAGGNASTGFWRLSRDGAWEAIC